MEVDDLDDDIVTSAPAGFSHSIEICGQSGRQCLLHSALPDDCVVTGHVCSPPIGHERMSNEAMHDSDQFEVSDDLDEPLQENIHASSSTDPRDDLEELVSTCQVREDGEIRTLSGSCCESPSVSGEDNMSSCGHLIEDLGELVLQDTVCHLRSDTLIDDLDDSVVDQLLSEVSAIVSIQHAALPSSSGIQHPALPSSSGIQHADLVENNDAHSSCKADARASDADLRLAVLERVKALLHGVEQCQLRGETAQLVVPSRATWRHTTVCSQKGVLKTNVNNERGFTVRDHCGTGKFSLMVLLLKKMKHLLETNSHSTKRDIYYQHVSEFCSQRTVDCLLTDLCRLLQVPRRYCHVRATSKGLVAGSLILRDKHVIVDCSAARNGVLVSCYPEQVEVVRSQARYILVIEKDATFQKLMDCGGLHHLPAGIFITGKGFPDFNTRSLLVTLEKMLRVPAVALMDADPHGLEIFFVYKYGSLSQVCESSQLACSRLQLLGVLPSEISSLHLPEQGLVPMKQCDYAKARSLLRRPYITAASPYLHELGILLECSHKAEIQSLDSLGADYLWRQYLPHKLASLLQTSHDTH